MTKFFNNNSDEYLEESTQDGQENYNENLPAEEIYDESPVEEGQLSVDVFQTKDNLIVKSTIAGVKPDDISIDIDNDILTIRGSRSFEEEIDEDGYFYQECYWGNFSRSIVLPVDVDSEKVNAVLKNGVLTITMPKLKKSRAVSVKVSGE